MESLSASNAEAFELPPYVADSYIDLKQLPDGRYIGTVRLLYHWTMHIDIDDVGYADRYCFATYELAKKAFDEWSGVGDPEGWHRHPTSGRRKDLTTGREWVDF
ncbi:hypothetical protein HFO56_01540 [Rhizobium laguerreae]|uniref:hypothetical protein n=1 Tax=Rhizobium laguerreae TaxID=1076926 RepID=UPI001C91A27A|nr:hypothetical protein [Rhizobium laguerreae]MBY3151093.1 hypothetical protein [Rhizobium laguerreae]